MDGKAVGEAHGEHVDPQDPEPGVEEAPQFLQPRVEENENSSEGHLLGTQIRPAAMGPEFENNLPAHVSVARVYKVLTNV